MTGVERSETRPSAAGAAAARPRAPRAGVTLVELVVGATLIVGIIGSAYACLLTGHRTGEEVERRMDILQSARVALDLMGRDLRTACPLGKDFALIGIDRTIREGVVMANLDFATHNWTPSRPGESDFCEVSYFVDRDPRTGGLALYRRRDPTPDDRPLEGGYREEIAAGVREFKVEYYDGLYWSEKWGSALDTGSAEGGLGATREFTNDPDDVGYVNGLPDAVRITLALGDPSKAMPDPRDPDAPPDLDRPLVFRTVVRLVLKDRTEARGGGATPEEASSPTTTETSTDDVANPERS